jgi:hypothetical protein
MLLIYNDPRFIEGLPQDEKDELFGTVDRLMAELTESGELVGGEALAWADSAKTVRVRDGVVTTTDGPFAESKEQFAGYLAVDVESEERAVEIASQWPDARWFAMEVRAFMDPGGGEEG